MEEKTNEMIPVDNASSIPKASHYVSHKDDGQSSKKGEGRGSRIILVRLKPRRNFDDPDQEMARQEDERSNTTMIDPQEVEQEAFKVRHFSPGRGYVPPDDPSHECSDESLTRHENANVISDVVSSKKPKASSSKSQKASSGKASKSKPSMSGSSKNKASKSKVTKSKSSPSKASNKSKSSSKSKASLSKKGSGSNRKRKSGRKSKK